MQSDVTLGRVRLNTETRMALNVEVGDIIEVKGRRSTPVRVFRTLQEDEDKAIVRIDGLTRKNAGVSIGDRVEVLRADAKPAERVVLAPVMENDYKIRFGHGTEEFVRRGLLKRPVAQGDALVIPGIALMSGYLPFIAVKTQPRGIVQIVESTDIVIKDEPVKDTDCVRRDETSADIGGLTAVRERVDHMISTLFTNPEVAGRAGVSPSPYLLLVGQSGCGKRSLVSSLARERGVEVRELRFAAFMMKTHSLAEAYLWDQVTSLNEAASSLLLIDDIDQIAPRVGEDGPEGRRVLAILISSHLDLLRRDRPVMVVGLAERLDAIDPDLLRPGRFEQVLHVPPPGPGDRRAILAVHLAGMALDESPPELWERAVAEVSQATGGFVGADLKLLCDEAGMLAISRISPSVDPDEPVPEAVLERLRITPQDLRDAAARVTPAVRRMAGPRSPPPGPAPDAPAPP
jgi:transitional endoplasmic reticulum ATPase